MFSQDPKLAPMYQAQNAYALMKDALKHQGILNVEEYLTPPDQLPQQQPDPMQQMQMQMAQKQLELQDRQTTVAERKAQAEAQIAAAKLELEKLKEQNSAEYKVDQMELKEEQFDHKVKVDVAELELARRADEIRAIASPNG